jgi:hypothetical protein
MNTERHRRIVTKFTEFLKTTIEPGSVQAFDLSILFSDGEVTRIANKIEAGRAMGRTELIRGSKDEAP